MTSDALPVDQPKPVDQATGPVEEPSSGKPPRPVWRELPLLIALALLLALLIKTFLVQAFSIPSVSMQNTLQVGDRVLVNKLVYDFRGIHRGEVVVFNGADDWAAEAPAETRTGVGKVLQAVGRFLGVASDDKDYIKRVIGLPGDRVMCCSPSGNVVVQPPGERPVELNEPYLFEAGDNVDPSKWFCDAGNDRASCPPGALGLLVPEGRLWVMGDHRGQSSDSRYHYTDPHRGTIAINRVVGRAFVVVWPITRGDVLEVPSTFTRALAAPGSPLVAGGVLALPVVVLRRRLRSPR